MEVQKSKLVEHTPSKNVRSANQSQYRTCFYAKQKNSNQLFTSF